MGSIFRGKAARAGAALHALARGSWPPGQSARSGLKCPPDVTDTQPLPRPDFAPACGVRQPEPPEPALYPRKGRSSQIDAPPPYAPKGIRFLSTIFYAPRERGKTTAPLWADFAIAKNIGGSATIFESEGAGGYQT